jgi:2-keto-3-deoxy-L-rhamnonate aldolase RhmA
VKSNRIKAMLAAGQVAMGGWVTIAHPTVAEIMAAVGFDWLLIDCEHGPAGIAAAQVLLQAMGSSQSVPFIRVADNDPALIKRALDIGAMGVVVPLVNDRASAERAVKSAKYPPQGFRGIGMARAQGYGLDFKDYFARANDEVMVIVQIEHAVAVANIEEIASVPGIDMFFLGPVDLSGSYGPPAVGIDMPLQVTQAIDRVITVAKRAGIPLGAWVPDAAVANLRRAQGFQFLGLSIDIVLLANACQAGLRDVKR